MYTVRLKHATLLVLRHVTQLVRLHVAVGDFKVLRAGCVQKHHQHRHDVGHIPRNDAQGNVDADAILAFRPRVPRVAGRRELGAKSTGALFFSGRQGK